MTRIIVPASEAGHGGRKPSKIPGRPLCSKGEDSDRARGFLGGVWAYGLLANTAISSLRSQMTGTKLISIFGGLSAY